MKPRQRVPVVTVLIIAANLVAAFAVLIDPDLIATLGFRPDHPSIVGAFTGLFLHANTLHLLGNMVFLAAVGAAVELATGSVRFGAVYLVGGLFGVAAHWAFTRVTIEPPPLIGASGCIAGCVAYYSARYTRLRVAIAPKKSIPVLAVTGVWIGLQIAGAFVRIGDPRGVAFWSHLGGLVAGGLLALIFRAPDPAQIEFKHEALDRMNERGPEAVVSAVKLHLEDHPNDVEALRRLVEAYRTLGDGEDEANALAKMIEIGPASSHPEWLSRLADLQYLHLFTAPSRMRFADQFASSEPALSRRLLESVLRSPDAENLHPDATLAMVALDRESHPERAAILLKELVANHPLHAAVDVARKRGWIA